MQSKSLAAKVWETLSPINVNDMTEKKGNLTYLSWASAVEVVGDHFPDHHFDTRFDKFDDGTVMVYAELEIREGEDSFKKHMWLPVMDHRNNAIVNPDARKISDAMMRCLAKCISCSTGLGLYIYRGEDLPKAEVEAQNASISKEQFELMMEGIAHAGIDAQKFASACKVERLDQLPVAKYDHAMGLINQRIAANAATEQQQ